MTTPRVTETPLRLTPVERDPFIDAPSRPDVAREPLDEARGARVADGVSP
jgi:hypothetical protein